MNESNLLNINVLLARVGRGGQQKSPLGLRRAGS